MKKIKKLFLFALLTVVLVTTGVFITSCGENDKEISISPSTDEITTLNVGSTAVLSFKVENYSSNGEIFVSSYDENGYSSGKNTSSKISFTSEYKGSGVTEVRVEGLEGGIATLVGTTQEGGNKTAQMVISVKKYSQTLELGKENVFVSTNTPLTPSSEMFVFSDNTTEKNLTYYYVENKNDIDTSVEMSDGGNNSDNKKIIKQTGKSNLTCLEFIKCELSSDKSELIFTQSEKDNDGNNKTFNVDISSLGDAFANYFIAEYTNEINYSNSYAIVKFNTFLGIDETKFTVTDGTNTMQKLDLVAYSTEANGKKIIKVTVPCSNDDKYVFDYTLPDEDKNKVSLLLKQTTQNDDNTKTYEYEVQTKVARKDNVEISFNLYYKDFYGVSDTTVSVSRKLNVNLQVQPNSMRVNGCVETDGENNYVLYNYNNGDYGWKELNLAVYAEDSTYDNVQISFDTNKIEVKQGNINLKEDDKITDLSKPILIRGKNGAETSDNNKITFKVKTSYEVSSAIEYKVKYSIQNGATKLEFSEVEYKYSTDNQAYGVYISSSNGSQDFQGIKADNTFGSAVVTSKNNSNNAQVEYQGNDAGVVELKITPVKEGNEWFNIRIDNGLSLDFLVRVVCTFEDMSVEKYGENSGLYSFSCKEKTEGTEGKEVTIIAKTNSKIELKVSDTNGAIKTISSPTNLSNLANINIEDGILKIETIENANGEDNGIFNVKGNVVNNFKIEEKTREIDLELNTYTLATEFNIYTDSEKKISASGITLYSSESIQNMASVTFVPEIKEANSYCFKSHVDNDFHKTVFENKYIYWTVGGNSYSIYEQGGDTKLSEMVANNKYEIKKDGTVIAEFNTTNLTFKVANNFTSNIVLFALIEQYGYKNAFEINITVKAYNEIKSLNVSLSGTEIEFTKLIKEKQIAITTPDLDATNLEIVCLIETTDGKSQLIENPKITSIKPGRWMVTLNLKEDVILNEGNYAKTILKICAKDWVDSNNQIKTDSPYKRYEIIYASGSVGHPYSLTTAQDIVNIGNTGMLSAHYELKNDIDISAYSDKLPLGEFSGSIKCSNGSKITGIKITKGKDFYYGLFSKLTSSAKIEGVTFEGSIDCTIDNSSETYVGLVAGGSAATIKNIAVKLDKSEIIFTNTDDTYVGAIFGKNEGSITKNSSTLIPVIMDEKMTVKVSHSSGCKVYAGGIAGYNTNVIQDTTTYSGDPVGYQAYMSYANISVVSSGSNLTSKKGFVYLGAISGYGTNAILGNTTTQSIVGGKLESNITNSYVGGVSGYLNGSDFSVENLSDFLVENLKVRTFVKGYNVGGVTAKTESVDSSNITNICLQAIDDGESVGEDASMIVKLIKDGSSSGWASCTDEVKKNNFIATGNSGWTLPNLTLENYVTRTFISDCALSTSLNQYHGNYFEYSANWVKNSYTFATGIVSMVTVEKKDGSVELESSGNPQMFTMYYFDAEGYYDSDSVYKTENLYKIQEIFDKKFNTVSKSSNLYPFTLSGGEYTLKSESSILSIDNVGNITLKGTGVAQIFIYNSLNLRNPKEIYIYVINYFNYAGLLNGTSVNRSLFSIGNNRLGSNVTMNLVADKNISINISPYYTTAGEYFGLDESENCIGINSEGVVEIGNISIQLTRDFEIGATIDLGTSNFANNAAYEISTKTITISKKTTPATSDEIILKNNLSVNVSGKDYTSKTGSFLDIEATINYKQGTTKVKNLYDKYVINTSSSQSDTITIESDDTGEEINWEITKTENSEIVYTQNTVGANHLFKVYIAGSSLTLSVDKDSNDYKNRYGKNIFGDYVIRFTGKTNQDTVYKDVLFTLDDRNLDSVIIENYPDISEMKESSKIVPGEYGILSVTLAPADVDFCSIVIENIDNNYNSGFSSGIFDLYGDIDCTNSIPYTPTTKGIVVTQTAIKETLGTAYNGQFFIKYLFGNNSALEDGRNVGISFKILKENNEEIYSDILNYTIDKQFVLDVYVKGKTQTTDGYLLAKGLTYELEIKNTGYQNSSIKLETSNTLIATIENINGKYYLKITSENVSVRDIDLIISGTRTDKYGKPIEQTVSKDCVIMEYVLNYNPTYANAGYDIIEGYENGFIVSSLTKKHQLSLDLSNYLEYDSSNSAVVKKIQEFVKSMNEQDNVWTLYSKLNVSDFNWDDIINGKTINSNIIKTSILSTTGTFENDYIKFNGLNYTLKKRHDPDEKQMYMFNYTAKYMEKTTNGIYEYNASGKELKSYFTLKTYTLGSEDSPIPVTDYTDLKTMKSGSYYILTSDITITSDTFSPIKSSFAYLDGNNKKIIFESGIYDISSYSDIGIFEEIGDETIVKNLKVVFKSDVEFNYSSDNPFVFGVIASSSGGVITNANVSGSFKFVNETSTSGSVACIAGSNSGKITNSQVSASVTVNGASLSGLVSKNSGVVASSYYKGGKLINNSEKNIVFSTSGLVESNSENGKILTSYTSGIVGSNIYSEGTNKDTISSLINSNVSTAGFVYSNSGIISDCYSSIPIYSGSQVSGFVYMTSGEITNCFMTSNLLQQEDATNYHFVFKNEIEEQGLGSFKNCFYLEDENKKINYSLAENTIDGIKGLDIEGFKNLTNFKSYAYGKGVTDYNNVWIFMGTTSNIYPFNTSDVSLTLNRLELVSANIIATSERVESGIVENEDGSTTYNYKYIGNQQGEMLNPYTVFSAEDFETYLSYDKKGYYRIVNNLDYSEVISKSYSYNFKGIIEGNGMNISNVEIACSESLYSSGFIASLKSDNVSISNYPEKAGIMNLSYVPTAINCSNASIVGGLVGVVENANVINVNVYSNLLTRTAAQTGNTVIISGYNIAGGVIGLVKGSCKIKNIESTVGSKATYIPSEIELKVYTTGIYSDPKLSHISYAGCVIGYAKSTNEIKIEDVYSYGINAYAIGDRVGFVFGGISKGVKVSNITVDVSAGMLLKAYSFAGIIIGECAGEISDIVVNGCKQDLAIFSVQPYTPTALGGIVGYMISGKLNKVYMGQSFNIPVGSNIEKTVNYVGGIIGYVNNNKNGQSTQLSQIVLDADVSARNYLGGIIGYAVSEVVLDQVAIHEHQLTQEGILTTSYVGGFIGYNESKVTITDSYSLETINSTVSTYSENIIANIGAILGTKIENSSLVDLKNIYTISKYNIKTENIGEKENKVKYDSVNKCLVYEGTTTKVEKLNYIFNKFTNSISKVYNYIGTEDNILSYTTDWIACIANDVNSSISISLNQNELGDSICSWYNTKEGVTEETNPNNKGKKLYYGLGEKFDYGVSDKKWYTPTDKTNSSIVTDLSTLKFEDSLRKS